MIYACILHECFSVLCKSENITLDPVAKGIMLEHAEISGVESRVGDLEISGYKVDTELFFLKSAGWRNRLKLLE